MKYPAPSAALVAVMLLAGCTVICIEGDSNSVRGIEGHTATVSLPASSQ